MTDLNKERELCNQSFEKYWDDFCEAYGSGFDRSLAKLFFANGWGEAKAQAVQQSFEIGRLQDRITELLDERQDLYAQINNDQAVPEGYVLLPRVPTEKMFQAYERYSVAPMSTLSKTGYKAMVEASESGAEG
ncbi:hypothetical protein OKC46_16440 [Acinetobacter baumannii]|uniref:hypothetical protein n=1 Tax=Acinetobacter baumannii TaxID=470 RepID=UPI00237F4611|nr:hypothetical protein [Acinetobacter baumannii]MDE3317280.1 hypothetical protein [Acinetobacter baumannii]MDX2339785.1 hypothetical protein [Acinetobacter baumannii]MDX5551553.1 hypothetical protein [Acinetobacter baumannii]